MFIAAKQAIVANDVFNAPVLCFLESSSKTVLSDNRISYNMTIGLDKTMSVAPRYVIDNRVLHQLHGNESQCKQQYMRSKNLTRTASVYYNINECVAVAKIQVTFDLAHDKIERCYTTFYSLPPNRCERGLECKPVALGFTNSSQVSLHILKTLMARGIISFSGGAN